MFTDHSTNHEVLLLTCRQVQERTGLSRSHHLQKNTRRLVSGAVESRCSSRAMACK